MTKIKLKIIWLSSLLHENLRLEAYRKDPYSAWKLSGCTRAHSHSHLRLQWKTEPPPAGTRRKPSFLPRAEVCRWGAATYWPRCLSTAAASGECEDRDKAGLPAGSQQRSLELSDLWHGKRKSQVWLKESTSCCVGVQLTQVNKYVTKLKWNMSVISCW